MSAVAQSGRLSTMQAALVIARRDFTAILFSRSFFFFLLGPLFPLIVGIAAGTVTQRTEQVASRPVLGLAMAKGDAERLIAAARLLEPRLGNGAPAMTLLRVVGPDETVDARAILTAQNGNVSAVMTGKLSALEITGTKAQVDGWRGPVSLIAAQALGRGPDQFPEIKTSAAAATSSDVRQGQMRTAQAGQTLLFLLTMLLAGMVLSNLVEEKGNKIIEVLAAAIPMDAVFYGKLFAMLGMSLVGIAVWGTAFGGLALFSGFSLASLTPPAVGWGAFFALGIAYFAMAYLLLGSLFLTVGSMATTVREVQTMSMPVSMSQLIIFFFAGFAAVQPGSTIALVAEVFPISSPYAMLSHAAQQSALLPHVLSLAWQALWVALFVHFGSRLFRKRVMKSGPQRIKTKGRKAEKSAASLA